MKCYLVRHGQADMSEHNTKIYRGFGADLAPLSIEGLRTIEETRRDERLEGADIVLSSPYTRALQSAAMISRVIDAPLAVETDLHEWLPNKDYAEVDDEATYQAYVEYCDNEGRYPQGEDRPWEDVEHLRSRILAVLGKYDHLDKVVVVSHGLAIHALTGVMLPNGGIAEYDPD